MVRMSTQHQHISGDLQAWIEAQRIFFVATAPDERDGHVNCSPKGLDVFRILGPLEVAYLDLTGSGAETVAHIRQNGRIVFMFCAFSGPPKIVRLHGTASVVWPETADWSELRPLFPPLAGARAIVRATVSRVSDSCGYAVPRFDFVDDRPTLTRWAEGKGDEGLREYQRRKNRRSIDGLPAVDMA